MIPHLSHVMTLANSIIGVSVLAMPFCFKQCGIVLAIIVLLTSSVLSRLACHFLIKSAVMSRRRNFEFLAFHAFGTTGKFLVELFIIGFLLATCIAFFVVVGDLGSQIIGKMLNKPPEDIRTSVLVTTGIFIVLPLGLLRNIDSLSSVCTATIGFYLCLVLKVIGESTRHVFLGDWYDRVIYWRPAGVLQCLPIFSMALFCQTQLFEIYEAIPNVCLEKMNQVVRGALNICTAVYLCVGFFGYVAFCTQPFTGNILMSFEPSLSSDVIKMGFVFSVAFSFPLVIFPCRASLNSLLYRRAHTHESANNYIPEVRFRCLTLAIVSMALGTGILIPNIEFLLGIVGSTIGVMICLIFPAAFFIAISTKNTNERLIAQAILFFGVWIMILGTYANIYAMEESSNARLLISTGKPFIDQINDRPFNKILKEDFQMDKLNVLQAKEKLDSFTGERNEIPEISDVRREPQVPVERTIITERSMIDIKIPEIPSVAPRAIKNFGNSLDNNIGEKSLETTIEKSRKIDNIVSAVKTIKIHSKADEKANKILEKNDNLIDSDAIKKEESELEAAAAGDERDLEAEARHEKLRKTLEKHKIEQLEMIQEQKQLLKDIKEQKQLLEDIKEQKELLKDIKEQKEVIELEKKRLANEQTHNEKKDEALSAVKNLPQNNILGEEGFMEKEKKSLRDGEKNSIDHRIKDPKNLSSQSPNVIHYPESRGPILNALTNWTLKKNEFAKNSNDPVFSINETTDLQKNDKKFIPPPIALRMNDKFPILDKTNDSLSPINRSKDDYSPPGRDILQNRRTNYLEKPDYSKKGNNDRLENQISANVENREKREIEENDPSIHTRENNTKNRIIETKDIEAETTDEKFVKIDKEQCQARRNPDNSSAKTETIEDRKTTEKMKIRAGENNAEIDGENRGYENEEKSTISDAAKQENSTIVKKRDLKELRRKVNE